MTRAQKQRIRLATLAAALLPALALAHPGHGESTLVAGALHPLSGLDHLAALFAAGLLAARLSDRLLWPLSATFLGLLVAAWTQESDGWQFAAGFMLASAGLIAAGVAATRILARRFTASGPRSPT